MGKQLLILTANKSSPLMQLNLALAWNRIDVAKSEIFTDEKHWTVSSKLCCFRSRATFLG